MAACGAASEANGSTEGRDCLVHHRLSYGQCLGLDRFSVLAITQ